MDGEGRTDRDPAGPALEVTMRGRFGMTAVDEQELDRRAPHPCHARRLPHDPDHGVGQTGLDDCPAEGRHCVEASRRRVDERIIVVLPAGLVFFRTVMVIDGVHGRISLASCRAQQHGRFTAVRTDLDCRPTAAESPCRFVQRAPLDFGHEASRSGSELEQLRHRQHIRIRQNHTANRLSNGRDRRLAERRDGHLSGQYYGNVPATMAAP